MLPNGSTSSLAHVLKGLRVGDESIILMITSGNMNAPKFVVDENL